MNDIVTIVILSIVFGMIMTAIAVMIVVNIMYKSIEGYKHEIEALDTETEILYEALLRSAVMLPDELAPYTEYEDQLLTHIYEYADEGLYTWRNAYSMWTNRDEVRDAARLFDQDGE